MLIWIILWVAGHVISDPDLQHRADTLKEILEWIIGFLAVGLNGFAVGGIVAGLALGYLLGCRDKAPGVNPNGEQR